MVIAELLLWQRLSYALKRVCQTSSCRVSQVHARAKQLVHTPSLHKGTQVYMLLFKKKKTTCLNSHLSCGKMYFNALRLITLQVYSECKSAGSQISKQLTNKRPNVLDPEGNSSLSKEWLRSYQMLPPVNQPGSNQHWRRVDVIFSCAKFFIKGGFLVAPLLSICVDNIWYQISTPFHKALSTMKT